MHRSFALGIIAVLAIMLAPFAGVLGVPASAVHADAAAPNPAPPDDEVIVITSAGQLRVDDPYTPTGYKPVSWNSGAETGFTVVAGGDFNGDGDAELVAARGSIVKVFDPVVPAGKAPVAFTVDLGSQRNARLLNTGDFDADGKDEFAVVNYVPGGSIQAALQIFDGGANATGSEWTQRNYAEYAIMFQDMGVGDFNADGADDLVLVRNPSQQDKLLMTWNVRNWSSIAQQGYDFGWLAAGGGNISSSNPGDEIAVTRGGVLAEYVSALIFRVSGTTYVDMVPNSGYKFYPYFTSLATGDLNGDADDEVVLLRDPGSASGTSLSTLNPFGATMRGFQVAGIGGGTTAWRLVRTGDIDGDGRDEVVIIRSDRYRIYTQPEVDNFAPPDTTGSFYVSSSNTNLPFMTLANVDGAGQTLGPTLSVTPASLSFSLDCGDTSPGKPLSITNSGTASSFAWQAQAIEDNGSGWLLIDTSSGTTPGTVNVSVRPGIAKGTYTGNIRITATDTTVQNRIVNIPVRYDALCSGFAVSPTTLNFNLSWGSTASQSVAISGPGPTSWTASVAPVTPTTSCSWLTLNAMSGTTPSTVNVLVNAATADLSFKQCLIIFAAVDPSVPGSPKTVTINLTVPDPGFVVTPAELSIRQPVGAVPIKSYVTIFRPGGSVSWSASALPISAAADLAEKLADDQATITAEGVSIDGTPVAAPDWLVILPSAGTTNPTTPTLMQVSVKPGTPAGTYNAVITVAASGDPTLTNPVQLVTVNAIVADFKFSFLPLVMR